MAKLGATEEVSSDTRASEPDFHSKANLHLTLSRALRRPFKLLFLSPIVICTVSIILIQSGTQNLILASLGSVFQEHYNFTTSKSGLVYLGVTIGFVLAASIFAKTSDPLSRLLARRKDCETQPEFRLPALILGVPFLSMGLFWHGWMIYEHLLWPGPIFGLLFIGIGLTTIQVSLEAFFLEGQS